MDKQKNSSSKITFSEKSFSNGFFSILKIILLFAACIFTSIIIVWPFWKFSTALPKAYTIAVLSVISIFLLFLIIKKVIHSKKSSVIKVFVNLAGAADHPPFLPEDIDGDDGQNQQDDHQPTALGGHFDEGIGHFLLNGCSLLDRFSQYGGGVGL